MAYLHYKVEVNNTTRRLGTIAKAIRPITYKKTPGKYGAFLFISSFPAKIRIPHYPIYLKILP